jgi:hypothetical protein
MADRSLMVGSKEVFEWYVSAYSGPVEAFFAMKKCNCLEPVWDIGRSLWSPIFERAVFEGCLLGKMEISFHPEFR